MSTPRFFATAAEFRRWLHTNHATATELLVGFHKVGSGQPSMTWPESVDEALCYGWIDGVRRSLGADDYTIRFTPRKARSIWSKVNVAKVEALIAQKRMMPAGLAAYERLDPDRSGIYSFEKPPMTFTGEARRDFRRNRAAWTFFEAQPPSYRQVATNYVLSAKRAETRARRLVSLIEHSSRGERLPQFVQSRKRG